MLRILRVAFGLALAVAAGWTMFPHLVGVVGSSGVVNAPLVTLRSPVDGHVSQASRAAGTPLRPGEGILVIEGGRIARDALEEAELRERMLGSERAALEGQLAALHAQKDELQARGLRHRDIATDWLERREAAARAQAEALAARLAGIDAALMRAERLAASGALSATGRDDMAYERAALEAEWRAARATADSLAQERRAVSVGLVLDQGAGEGLYIRQALDARALQIAELEGRLSRVTRDLEGARIRSGQARSTLQRQNRFTPTAPSVGAIWTDSPAVGTAVITGDAVAQVLDCAQRFLEVTVPERHFSRLEVGTAASMRLRGSDEWRPTQVISLLGAGAVLEGRALAAKARNTGAGELRVVLGHPDPEAEPARFCDVGRSVEVRFHTHSVATDAWAWLTVLTNRVVMAWQAREPVRQDGASQMARPLFAAVASVMAPSPARTADAPTDQLGATDPQATGKTALNSGNAIFTGRNPPESLSEGNGQ